MIARYEVLMANLGRSAVPWVDETVVGLSGRGVPPSINSLDVISDDRYSACCFSCSRCIRVRSVDVHCLFLHLLLIYCCIVFIWLSTQAKRKLWRLVSLASGREPS